MKLLCTLVEDDDDCDWLPDNLLSAAVPAPENMLFACDWWAAGAALGMAAWRAVRSEEKTC